jgi:hypothetical protein
MIEFVTGQGNAIGLIQNSNFNEDWHTIWWHLLFTR